MFKKVALLGAVIGAVAAVMLPASASATWKHHTVPIQQDQTRTITGNARFQGALGGIECQGKATAVFFASQTTGQIQSYGADPVDETTNCKGLGGLAFCQVHNWTATELPWTFHTGKYVHIPATETHITTTPFIASEPNLTITTGQTHAQFTGAFCPVKASFTTPGFATITPNQPNTITSGQLKANLVQHMQTTNGTVDAVPIEVLGSLTISAPDAHTYDI
jgi:hypothetical protein